MAVSLKSVVFVYEALGIFKKLASLNGLIATLELFNFVQFKTNPLLSSLFLDINLEVCRSSDLVSQSKIM